MLGFLKQIFGDPQHQGKAFQSPNFKLCFFSHNIFSAPPPTETPSLPPNHIHFISSKIPSNILAQRVLPKNKQNNIFPLFPFPSGRNKKWGRQPTKQPKHEAHLGEILGQLPRMVDACGLSNASTGRRQEDTDRSSGQTGKQI